MKVCKNTILSFRQQYGTVEQCVEYLVKAKWGEGYNCKRCNHKEYRQGNKQTDRRCRSCGHHETPTSCTIFHSIKMSLPIAFEMVYRISVNKKGISTVSLSREFGLNPKTAYAFKQKVQRSMSSSGRFPLKGIVHVDEFMLGGPSPGCPGRSSESKKHKINIAVEIVKDKKEKEKPGRLYAMELNNFSGKELKKIFDTHIDKTAQITTDEWTGYKPLQEEYTIEQIPSENGTNFKTLHLMIMNIKTWIRGIHHKVSSQHLKKYLDEFCFRFNRRNHIRRMHEFVLQRMVDFWPKSLKSGFCN